MPLATVDSVDVSTLFDREGMLLLTQCVEPRHCEELVVQANSRIAATEGQLAQHSPGLSIGNDMFVFKEIASRGRQRFDMLLSSTDVVFTSVDAPWLPVVATLMQCPLDQIKKQVSVIYSRPGAPNQDWHCDGGHEQDDAGWPDQSRQLPKAYAVCVFLPLIDFNETVGYTDFWRVKQLPHPLFVWTKDG